MNALRSTKFWASIGMGALQFIPGAGVATTIAKKLGGVALDQLLESDSGEAAMFTRWVRQAKELEKIASMGNREKHLTLEAVVRSDLSSHYGKPPKERDVQFSVLAAVKQAHGDFSFTDEEVDTRASARDEVATKKAGENNGEELDEDKSEEKLDEEKSEEKSEDEGSSESSEKASKRKASKKAS